MEGSSNLTASIGNFLFQVLQLNVDDINLVHGLFGPWQQEAGAYIDPRVWWDLSPINGTVKVEIVKGIDSNC